MSDPISASTFSANVAALTINITNDKGATVPLTILTRTTTPPQLNTLWPMLSPMGKFKMNAVDTRQSCSATPLWSTQWTAKYGYYHCPAGRMKLWQVDNIISANVMAIRNAIALNCKALGVNDLAVAASEETVVLQWADKKMYLGGTIDIRVLDYRNL